MVVAMLPAILDLAPSSPMSHCWSTELDLLTWLRSIYSRGPIILPGTDKQLIMHWIRYVRTAHLPVAVRRHVCNYPYLCYWLVCLRHSEPPCPFREIREPDSEPRPFHTVTKSQRPVIGP